MKPEHTHFQFLMFVLLNGEGKKGGKTSVCVYVVVWHDNALLLRGLSEDSSISGQEAGKIPCGRNRDAEEEGRGR